MPVSAGELDRRIRFERRVTGRDDYGGEVTIWSLLCLASAKVMFGRGDERRSAAQENASLPATFRVRHNARTAAVKPADRIVFDGGLWDIKSNVLFERDGRDITAIRAA